MKKTSVWITIGLYLVSSIVSYMVFSNSEKISSRSTATQSGSTPLGDETALGALLEIDPSEPKDQVCPLNGAYYTQTEKNAWEKRRPLAVMIENAPDARPHSGLSSADVVYEIVAEGGVTRFMALYYCGAQRFDVTVAPVRSARTYFLDYASGYNFPLYAHVGGANTPGPADALGQISDYGWSLQNDLNQFSIGYPTFVRNANRLNRPVATEHTMESTTELLWGVGEEREWTNMSPARRIGRLTYEPEDWKEGFEPWVYQDEVPAPGTVTSISHDFWSGYEQYRVKWDYNSETNTYARTMGGEAHVDLNTDEQISASNVIVILTEEKGPIDEVKHMLYATTGTGDALLFKNGQAIEATWVKKDRMDELTFVDKKGDDIEFVRGATWIAVVDTSTEVTY
ncbi:MAG: DUF3048 domain-containing protein [Microgenomates group bacterium]